MRAASPSDLPVEAAIPGLRDALGASGAAVLQAEPGAGKTTIVPLRLLDEPWLGDQRIIVLEPRRLATRAAARRMAALLGTEVGELVGYRTRDDSRISDSTRIEVVTEGILTRRLQRDPTLNGTGLVIFDEIHERNLQTDLALALTLDVRNALRPELRLLAMSATLDVERTAALLGAETAPAPVIRCEGRQHPIELLWSPPDPHQQMPEAAAKATATALADHEGDILVFLAGARDIRRTQALLGRRAGPHAARADVDIRPLFGALDVRDQDLALAPSDPGRRRVVLSTDIAETSLTVAGMSVVIDSGQVRTPYHDPRTGLSRLQTGQTSRASAEQRAGRAGRVGPGVAYRLWSAAEHATRPAFTAAEITTADLTGLVLELASWGSEADELSWLDPPPGPAMSAARELLVTLGAVDTDGRITTAGKLMGSLPVHPRLAAMVIGARNAEEQQLAVALAALLEERDVLRGHPDALSTDIAERARLILDPGASHEHRDVDALRFVRHRARELLRRAPPAGATSAQRDTHADTDTDTDAAAGTGTGTEGGIEAQACGPILTRAYPDRIAQARGGGRFRLRHGTGAFLPTTDPLSSAAFLVVADLDGPARHTGGSSRQANTADARIRLAAAIDEGDIDRLGGDAIETITTLRWDDTRDDLRSTTQRRLDSLVLAHHDITAVPGVATTAALLDQVRSRRLDVLGWSPAARGLQLRAAFLARTWAEQDLSPMQHGLVAIDDDALLDDLDGWLTPLLGAASGRDDLAGVDMYRVLRGRLGHAGLSRLDELAPTSIRIGSQRRVDVDYSGRQPAISVRAQDLYGTTTHPTVAAGSVPIVVTLLSPARRPIQVTSDLPGFWKGSWAEVRKDMAGRYPKHDWRVDPSR